MNVADHADLLAVGLRLVRDNDRYGASTRAAAAKLIDELYENGNIVFGSDEATPERIERFYTEITAVEFRVDEIVPGVPGPTEVWARTAACEPVLLFRFFPDELQFTTDELVGLTFAEARDLHHRRDVDYLRS